MAGVEPIVDSLILVGHSVAAMQGPSARPATTSGASLALELVKGPYVTEPAIGPAARAGLDELDERRGFQHLVFDAEVVDGLVYAYRARNELQLPESTGGRHPRRRVAARPAARSGAARRSA